ncbi:hypothetical protein [Paenacidovorax caeni]|nr:hypothetical protein [Paenacidovorax caeni]
MKDHIPLPAPDYTEDVQGFVHDTQRHYYAEETMRAYAERLHAARVNSPAIMQAIGLLAVLQSWIGPRRPESSEPEEQALWDQTEATRIALTPLAPAGAPTTQAAPAHPDDAAVDALAAAMKAKLTKQRAKGYSGWGTPECTQQRLSDMLRAHVDKGDPVDVANFCAFLAARGEGIAQAAPVARGDAEVLSMSEALMLKCVADAGDAARWRWLSSHIMVAWNEGRFTSLVRIVSDENRASLNASVDRMMGGDWSDVDAARSQAKEGGA